MKRASAEMRAVCALLLFSCAAAGVAGCRGQTSTSPPILPLRNMFDQDRYDPQAESDFFPDKRTMRIPVAGTVPREREVDPEVGQGRLPDDSGYVPYLPGSVVARAGGMEALVNRGQAARRAAPRIDRRSVNGNPGAMFTTAGGEVVSVIELEFDGAEIRSINGIVNPEKLQHVGVVADPETVLRALKQG